jgi:hypothetical protein
MSAPCLLRRLATAPGTSPTCCEVRGVVAIGGAKRIVSGSVENDPTSNVQGVAPNCALLNNLPEYLPKRSIDEL